MSHSLKQMGDLVQRVRDTSEEGGVMGWIIKTTPFASAFVSFVNQTESTQNAYQDRIKYAPRYMKVFEKE